MEFAVDISSQLKSVGFDNITNSLVTRGALQTITKCEVDKHEIHVGLRIEFENHDEVSNVSVLPTEILFSGTGWEQFNSKVCKKLDSIPSKLKGTCLKHGKKGKQFVFTF